MICNNMLSTLILSGKDKNLVKYIDKNILNLNEHNSRSLLKNLEEVDNLETKIRLLAIARMDHMIAGFKNSSQILVVLSLVISLFTLMVDKLYDVGQIPNVIVFYIGILGSLIAVTGILMIYHKKKINKVMYFKSILEKINDEKYK